MTAAGAVLCWGSASGAAEQDPDPGASYPSSAAPVPVRGLTSGVQSVAVGEGFACALSTAGAVQCWGSNGGQLGNGSTADHADYPTPVSGLTSGVQAIAAGADNACALTTAGAVLCWGAFPGDGSTPPPYTYAPTVRVPVQVSGLTSGVRAITAGREFSCAVLDSGEARCWGSGGAGELGDGDSTEANAYTPVTVTGGHRYVAISGGANFACAVTSAPPEPSTAGGRTTTGNSEPVPGSATRSSYREPRPVSPAEPLRWPQVGIMRARWSTAACSAGATWLVR